MPVRLVSFKIPLILVVPVIVGDPVLKSTVVPLSIVKVPAIARVVVSDQVTVPEVCILVTAVTAQVLAPLPLKVKVLYVTTLQVWAAPL